jgi:hypothetical protein
MSPMASSQGKPAELKAAQEKDDDFKQDSDLEGDE